MVQINIKSREQFTGEEINFLLQIANLMYTHPSFLYPSTLLYNNELVQITEISDKDTKEIKKNIVRISYDFFKQAVIKGMNTELQIKIHTTDGEKEMTTPFLPVTLVEMPCVNSAAISLNYVPEFLPEISKTGHINVTLKGKLLDFTQKDIDEEKDDDRSKA